MADHTQSCWWTFNGLLCSLGPDEFGSSCFICSGKTTSDLSQQYLIWGGVDTDSSEERPMGAATCLTRFDALIGRRSRGILVYVCEFFWQCQPNVKRCCGRDSRVIKRAEKSTIMQPTFSVKKKTHLTNITVSFQLIQSRYSGQVRR